MTQKTLSRRPVSTQSTGNLALAWGKDSNQGPRSENQDAVIVVAPRDPQIARKGVLMVVCDGVGGAQGGRRASEIASTVAYRTYYEDPGTDVRASIDVAIRQANAAVKEEASRNPAIASMATTIVATVVLGNVLYVGHVGDSRAYLFHADGRIERITRDHNWVAEQVERGILTEQQAKENPMRNVITRSLGAASNNTADHRQFTLTPGDTLMVCTDGLHGVVADDQMRAILKRGPTPQKAAEALVAAGLANKTTDNTTAAVLVASALVSPSRGIPIPLLAGVGAVALLAALGVVFVLGQPSGGGDTPGVPPTATAPIVALPTPRTTGGTAILVGGDATPTPVVTLDPSKPTATLAPELPTPTPVPTRLPATPTPLAISTPPPAQATPTTPTDGGSQPGPAPTSPPSQPTATTANVASTPTSPPPATATPLPLPPLPTEVPKPTVDVRPTKPRP